MFENMSLELFFFYYGLILIISELFVLFIGLWGSLSIQRFEKLLKDPHYIEYITTKSTFDHVDHPFYFSLVFILITALAFFLFPLNLSDGSPGFIPYLFGLDIKEGAKIKELTGESTINILYYFGVGFGFSILFMYRNFSIYKRVQERFLTSSNKGIE